VAVTTPQSTDACGSDQPECAWSAVICTTHHLQIMGYAFVVTLLLCLQGLYAFHLSGLRIESVPTHPTQSSRSSYVLQVGTSDELNTAPSTDVDSVVDMTASIPKYLPSAMEIDYVPLATMLATGDFEAADQFTRDNLIKIAGKDAEGRGYVYWTEVKRLPSIDLATMERLWLQFSNGNFGYSIQKRVWDIENGNFDNFIRRIGWTKIDNDAERKLKWFGKSEFIYDTSAPKGHLPLTSALRGTQLISKLMKHPVWEEYDWKNYDKIEWPTAP
jgi:hypothetical protein